MKLFTLLLVLFCISCSEVESEKVKVAAVVTKVSSAGPGQIVRDPSQPVIDGLEAPTVELKDGYFSFELVIENNSENSVVLSNILVEVLEHGNNDLVVLEKEFSGASIFLGSYPGFQDSAGRYIVLVGGGESKRIGVTPIDNEVSSANQNVTQFYVDGLERKSITNYLYDVRITLEGIFTEVPRGAQGVNPFERETEFFERIVYFSVK